MSFPLKALIATDPTFNGHQLTLQRLGSPFFLYITNDRFEYETVIRNVRSIT